MTTKNCRKCRKDFQCDSNDIKNCPCNIINIPERMKTDLNRRFDDCICAPCIQLMIDVEIAWETGC